MRRSCAASFSKLCEPLAAIDPAVIAAAAAEAPVAAQAPPPAVEAVPRVAEAQVPPLPAAAPSPWPAPAATQEPMSAAPTLPTAPTLPAAAMSAGVSCDGVPDIKAMPSASMGAFDAMDGRVTRDKFDAALSGAPGRNPFAIGSNASVHPREMGSAAAPAHAFSDHAPPQRMQPILELSGDVVGVALARLAQIDLKPGLEMTGSIIGGTLFAAGRLVGNVFFKCPWSIAKGVWRGLAGDGSQARGKMYQQGASCCQCPSCKFVPGGCGGRNGYPFRTW